MRKRHSLKQTCAMLACPRKWAAAYLFKLPEQKTPQQQEGIDFHNACARLLKGQPVQCAPKIEALARTAVWYATPGMLPEQRVSFELFGRKLEVRLDALCPSYASYADWKKSSGPQYEMTEDDLRNDPQQNFQSYAIMQASGRIEVQARWIYVDKHPRKSGTHPVRPVEIAVGYDQAETWLLQTALPAMQTIEMYRGLWDRGLIQTLQDVPHDGGACKHRGHFCESFLGHCQMAPCSKGISLVQLRTAAKRELRTIVER